MLIYFKREYELKGHTDAVMQINWNPATTDVLASASYDKSVRIWDVRCTYIINISLLSSCKCSYFYSGKDDQEHNHGSTEYFSCLVQRWKLRSCHIKGKLNKYTIYEQGLIITYDRKTSNFMTCARANRSKF